MKEFEKMDKHVNDIFETLAAATRPDRNVQDVADHLDDQIKQIRELRGLPKIVHMITVKKGSQTSLHGSFKKACKSYGWNYNKLIRGGIPNRIESYKITKVETEITIDSMQLRRFMEKSFIIENDFDEDWREHAGNDVPVVFDFFKDDEFKYSISTSFYIREIRDVASTSNGYVGDLDMTTYEPELNEIVSVYDDKGDEIKLDLKTEYLLKKHLTI